MSIRVCLAGATGWAGSELARAVAGADDLELVAAVARRQAGRVLGEELPERIRLRGIGRGGHAFSVQNEARK